MNGFLELFLYCFFLFERLDTEYKVHDMAYPHHADDDTGYPYFFPCHHEYAKAHQKCYCGKYADLCSHQHTFLLSKRFQVLLIQLRSDEPVMELLRALLPISKLPNRSPLM